MENTSYLTYVKEVFQYFHGCNVGEGCELLRLHNKDAHKNSYEKQHQDLFFMTVVNLAETGYLSGENDFFVLTRKGYDFLQDGKIEQNKVALSVLMQTYRNDFSSLWLIIGNKDTSLFYLNASEYYKVARSFILNLPDSYTDYINQHRFLKSRLKFYSAIFNMIPKEEKIHFFNSLANAIERVWGNPIGLRSSSDTHASSPSESLPTQVVPANSDESLTVFISYSHDKDEHKEWVYKLVTDLREAGLNVRIDEDIPLGTDLTRFMEDCVASSDRVLLILTNEYKSKADNRSNGVGYESNLITSELVNDASLVKFIPIMRDGSKAQCYPIYLGNRKGLDMTDDRCYKKNLQRLISDIRNNTKKKY